MGAAAETLTKITGELDYRYKREKQDANVIFKAKTHALTLLHVHNYYKQNRITKLALTNLSEASSSKKNR